LSKNRNQESRSEAVRESWEAARRTTLELIRLFGPPPPLAVVLGSGLQKLGPRYLAKVPFRDLPLPKPQTAFHRGQIGVVTVRGRRLVVVEGRAHMYDGYTAQQATVLVAALSFWGVGKLLSTGICGVLGQAAKPGQWVTFGGHLNLTGDTCWWKAGSPRGKPAGELQQHLRDRAAAMLVVAGIRGPSLPTSAEYVAFGQLGAQAVSMSAVPERLAAQQLDLDHASLYLVTDYWDGSRFVGSVREARRLAQKASGQLWETVEWLTTTTAESGEV